MKTACCIKDCFEFGALERLIPDDFPFQKPGNLKFGDNWRGIVLLGVMGRITL